MKTRRWMMLTLAAAAATAACDRLGFNTPSTTSFKGFDITGSDYKLSLPDAQGQMRTMDHFKGKVAVVFFGYTQCPDACPTTMAELAQLKKALGKDGDRVQGIFVTVDPERDTPQVLKAYVASFDPSFIALRGTPEQTAAAAKEFKVFFAKSPGKTPGSYTVDHTAGSYLFDLKGKVRVFERYGSSAEVLAADVRALLAAG
jgi:protein SCO1/2